MRQNKPNRAGRSDTELPDVNLSGWGGDPSRRNETPSSPAHGSSFRWEDGVPVSPDSLSGGDAPFRWENGVPISADDWDGRDAVSPDVWGEQRPVPPDSGSVPPPDGWTERRSPSLDGQTASAPRSPEGWSRPPYPNGGGNSTPPSGGGQGPVPPSRPGPSSSQPKDGGTPSRRKIILRRILIAALAVFLVFAGVTLIFVIDVLATAPDLDEAMVAPHGYRSAVLDDAGEEILTLAGAESNRVYVTLDQIPEDLQNAFIAIEDERFYSHGGVDVRGMIRALFRNLASGRLSQGASTITQQLIKNNVYSAGMGEKTAMDKIRRKLQEQYLAVKLERRTSKAWILENYLNTINLGGGAWGVQTAAQRYFGKEVSDLTLPECAAIAAITQSPSAFNPLRNPERNQERQRLVLSQMVKQGMITENQYLLAVEEDIYTGMKENAIGTETRAFSWFEDAAVSQVAEDLQTLLGYSETAAWQLLYRGGLTIETTQNTALQRICEEEANNASTDAQMTVVVIDPSDGTVKALVGGRGEKTASLTWNRALSSPRQPGSTIKVVGEYAAALDSGLNTLATVYDDGPTYYSNGTAIRNAGGSYQGRTSIRRAITVSLNTVALRCFQSMGLDAVWNQLERFGFAHLDDNDRVEALALGGTHGGVTNLELTAAYAAIANQGVYTEPRYYTRILDREGEVLLDRAPLRWTAVKPATAELLTSAMEDVLTSGTGTDAAFRGQSLAGKSGTTTDRRDLWFVGFSPYLVCGVWGGYDDNSPQSTSAPVKTVWRGVMRRAHENLPQRSFSTPELLEQRTVCTKCGNLAVEGMCDDTVQGNMTRQEWFAAGTAPTARCTCHVRVDTCTVSGQRAGLYCRSRTSQVYLAEGTPGTADESAVCPGDGTTCTVHQGWFDWLLPGEQEDEEVPPSPEDLPPAQWETEDGEPGTDDTPDPPDPEDGGQPDGETGPDTPDDDTGGEPAGDGETSIDDGTGSWLDLLPGTVTELFGI